MGESNTFMYLNTANTKYTPVFEYKYLYDFLVVTTGKVTKDRRNWFNPVNFINI